MIKKAGQFIVVKNIQLNHNNHLIELKSEISFEGILPGQFVNVLVEDSPSTFLRRPFSIYDINYITNTISLIIKDAGAGSRKLNGVNAGEIIDMIYPLGNGFSIDSKTGEKLLIGGGVGVAPLYLLAKMLHEKGIRPHILLGARTINDHILIDDFKQFGHVHLTTDDGSLGTKGFVVDHEIWQEGIDFEKIYCCGPEPMMKAVSLKASRMHIECEVSLENMMACGFGVCLCCVTKTVEGNKCVCTEGPVFNSNDLEWLI